MKLHDLLLLKNKNELKSTARELQLKGFSSLNKQSLVDLLAKNLQNVEIIEQTLNNLTKSERYLLALLLKEKGKSNYNDIKTLFTANYSSTTFYRAYNGLLSSSLAFEMEEDNNTSIIIPDEYRSTMEKIIVEKYPNLDIKPELDEEETDQGITYLDDIFSIYTTKDSLQELLVEAGLKKTGKKEEVIQRLLYESTYDTETLLDTLLTKPILKEVCREIGIPVGGNKADLINRITSNLALKEQKKQKMVKPKKKRALASVGSIETVSEKIKNEEKQRTTDVIPLLDEVFAELKTIEFRKKGIRNEDDLEREVLGFLNGWNRYKHKESHTVEAQSIGAGGGKVQIPDIAIDVDEVYIELKYIRSQEDIDRSFRQASHYGKRAKQGVVFFIYDPQEKMNENDISSLNSLPKTRIIVRR